MTDPFKASKSEVSVQVNIWTYENNSSQRNDNNNINMF